MATSSNGKAGEATPKDPPPLTNGQRALAGLLMVGGALLIWGVLDVFLTGGEWLVEDTVTKGEGPGKTVTTKKYSDTLPLAALGVGGVLILCGAFYARLRKVKLPGGGELEFGDAKEKLQEKVEEKAKEKADQGEVEPEKVEDLKQVALAAGSRELLDVLTTRAAPPADRDLDLIADRAVESARKLL